jgi:hypothetical protein
MRGNFGKKHVYFENCKESIKDLPEDNKFTRDSVENAGCDNPFPFFLGVRVREKRIWQHVIRAEEEWDLHDFGGVVQRPFFSEL